MRLEELAQDPFISFKKGYGMRTLTDQFCAQAGFAPHVVFEGEDVATVSVLVSSGIGVTLIPSFRGITPSKIKKLRVTEPVCRREIGLAWLKGRALSPSGGLVPRLYHEPVRIGLTRAPASESADRYPLRDVGRRLFVRKRYYCWPFTTSFTSMLPRVAFEYGHTPCAAFTSSSAVGRSTPSTFT